MRVKRVGAVVLVAVGLAVGLALNGVVSPPGPAPVAAGDRIEDSAEVEELAEFAGRLERLFQHAAARVKPAVVSIQSTRVVVQRTPRFFDSPFDEFFRRQMPEMEEFFGGGQRERRIPGLGSGVILDQDGNILTNNHVVAEADELEVQLADGRRFAAEVIGSDPKTDLAVIRLDGEFGDLPTGELGDSETLQVAQWVLAVGSPFGLTQTVSAGIVSAKGRSGITKLDYESMIQTDAAINPGNSGGPLINLRGEVVGINTAIYSRTGGYMGIGFAIPINMARGILDDLIAGREPVRGWLGVSIRNLTPEMAEMFDYEGTDGVLVDHVVEGSPAEEAGLKAGDIIMEYNGKSLSTIDQLQQRVTATEPNTTAKIVVWREGARKTLKVKVGDLASSALAEDWLGLTVRNLTPEMAKQMGRPQMEGVIIADVDPESPPARYLKPGQVIESVNRQRVASVEDYRRKLSAVAPGSRVLLRVYDPERGVGTWITARRPVR